MDLIARGARLFTANLLSELDLRADPGEERIVEIADARANVLQVECDAEPRRERRVVEHLDAALLAEAVAGDRGQAVGEILAERGVEETDAEAIEAAVRNWARAGYAAVDEPSIRVRVAVGDERLAEDPPALRRVAGTVP
jgi:hypothetical protein